MLRGSAKPWMTGPDAGQMKPLADGGPDDETVGCPGTGNGAGAAAAGAGGTAAGAGGADFLIIASRSSE